jgi:hypothetical protein
MRILVADSDTHVNHDFFNQLVKKGHHVAFAYNLAYAFNLWKSLERDWLIIGCPSHDGLGPREMSYLSRTFPGSRRRCVGYILIRRILALDPAFKNKIIFIMNQSTREVPDLKEMLSRLNIKTVDILKLEEILSLLEV